MKHEKLSDALGQIRDEFIADAAQKKRRKFPWLGTVAAALAVCLLVGLLPGGDPGNDQLQNGGETTAPDLSGIATEPYYREALLAAPQYPQLSPYPAEYDSDSYDAWWNDQRTQHDQPKGYAENLQGYFGRLIPQLLQGSEGENVTCSPVNIYMALSMLAETTGGDTRQQLLNLLKADSIASLRTQAGDVWNAHYNNDGLSTSILGSSLWLHEAVPYNETTVNTLADSYYASVFRGALGSADMNRVLQGWLNEQTGGLLQEQAGNIELAPNSTMAIATTVLYQVQWIDEFREKDNTQAVFHGARGDTTETFMNRQLTYGPYYWSDNFAAVYLSLEDGSRMWLLLPDEGVAPETILEEAGAFLAQKPYAYDSSYANQKEVIVKLSLPKFDVASSMDLVQQLKKLGVTDVFTPGKADFSPLILSEDGGYVGQVQHATRVSIDEQGVTAAAFTVIDRCGAGMPPTEQIDMTFDRPFVFYIESRDGLPLFTGIVNEP